LVLLAVLPLLGLAFYTAAQQRAAAAAQAQQQLAEIAQLAAAGQVRLFEGARQLLSALAQMPTLREGKLAGTSDLLARLTAQHRFYADLGLVAPHGALLCSAVPAASDINVAEQEWFKEARRTGQFAIGGFQVSLITGKPVFVFGQPVFDATNHLQSVLSVALDLNHLSHAVSQLQLPAHARLVVVDRQGTVIASSAGYRERIGQPAAELAVLQQRGEFHAVRVVRAPAEGKDFLYAIAPVGLTHATADAWVSVSLPTAAVFAETQRQLRQQLAGLGLVSLLALAGAWFGGEIFILRRVRALVAAARHMAAGELGARTGVPHGMDELGQLAAAFDDMATSLQQRDAERLRAADALRRSRDELEVRVQDRAAELTAERNLLRRLVDSLPDYVYVKDRNGRYLLDNATHRSLLGAHRAEDVIGRTAHDFFPPELARQYEADDQAVLQSGVPMFHREEEVVDHHGNRLRVVTTKVPLRDDRGQIIGLVGVGRDISDRR
jgi:PAS domain S-box-containing protein